MSPHPEEALGWELRKFQKMEDSPRDRSLPRQCNSRSCRSSVPYGRMDSTHLKSTAREDWERVSLPTPFPNKSYRKSLRSHYPIGASPSDPPVWRTSCPAVMGRCRMQMESLKPDSTRCSGRHHSAP